MMENNTYEAGTKSLFDQTERLIEVRKAIKREREGAKRSLRALKRHFHLKCDRESRLNGLIAEREALTR